MASSRRGLPEINAGSMADIAFLLLIFFLVTTTMDQDTGIARKLPPMPEEELQEDDSQIHAKNIYVVLINAKNQLLVEGELMDISQLKDGAMKFINNNGIDPNSSENPEKAIISLQNDRGTEYMTYIRVQNELAAAYSDLRNNASLNSKDSEQTSALYSPNEWPAKNLVNLKSKLYSFFKTEKIA